MKIGILVNTDKHLEAVVGLSNAAVSMGHDVAVFVMDDGTKLLSKKEFNGLCAIKGIHISFCDHSAQSLNSDTESLPKDIVRGSQYDNAKIMHGSDRVIVL